jgi:TrmH family RNA methyltransferase
MNNRRVKYSKDFENFRENLYFILVNPESQGNIGAAARALKTSGFKNLILVNPPELDHEDVRKMAHRSLDIVKNAQIVNSFDEAIKDMHLIIGTTMRKRQLNYQLYSPDEAGKKLMSAAIDHPVALVFGSERNGLTNIELSKCHIQSTITTATQKPALNLAQAVMIYAHHFFTAFNSLQDGHSKDFAVQKEYEKFYSHLVKALEDVNFVPRDGMEQFLIRTRRLFGRLQLESRDIRMMHKLLQIFEKRIIQLETKNSPQKKEIY